MLICLSGSQQHCSLWLALILRLVSIHCREGGKEAGEGGNSEAKGEMDCVVNLIKKS